MIRGATAADLPAICRMASEFIHAHFDGMIEDNPDQVAKLADQMMLGGDDRLLLLNDDGHGANGMFAAFIFEHPISGKKTASEVAWWVDPSARGSIGIALLRRAEAWAKTTGAVRMQMVAPNERVGEFYRRVGYEKAETAWSRRL